MEGQQMKIVYTVVDRPQGKSFWARIGVGFVNRDGSLSLRLDALPVNGALQVRDWEPRDDAARRGGDRSPEAEGEAPASRAKPRGGQPRSADFTEGLV